MAQLHKIDWATDRKTARTWSWVLDTGVKKHGPPSLVVSKKYGVNNDIGRVSSGNKKGQEHKIVSASNVNSRLCDRRTLYRSTPEGFAIGFDMGIITDAMREIDRWRH